MADWYAFRDPRQFYYGTYVQARAKMQEVAESNYAFFEKRNLARLLSDAQKQQLIRYLVPLRHVEHAANLNNMYGTGLGMGTALTQGLLYNGMDRLGIAQYLSRIGLIVDGNSGESLVQAKQVWMEESIWQGVRKYCETMMVTEDWFEVMLAQDIVLDSLVYDLIYTQLDAQLADNGAQDVAMLTEFMQDWWKDSSRWGDAVLKTAVAESAENKALVEEWVNHWRGLAVEALAPLADEMLGDEAMDKAVAALDKRLTKAGLFK